MQGFLIIDTIFKQDIKQDLSKIISVSRNKSSHISNQIIKLFTVMEKDISYNANELLALLNNKTKETLRGSYLNPALENSLIRMTLPNKPNSKNRKYIR